MKMKLVTLLTIVLCFTQACNDKQSIKGVPLFVEPFTSGKPAASIYQYNNTKGYGENGSLIIDFNCPDDTSFPPISINSWDKIRVVNGRLPTYEETKNGTSIHHYGEKKNPDVKPYHMILPKLAYYDNGPTKLVFDSKTGKEIMQPEVVVVIQVVKTSTDTVVGYRYLSGGCGGGKFHKFHFLTDEEVRDAVGYK